MRSRSAGMPISLSTGQKTFLAGHQEEDHSQPPPQGPQRPQHPRFSSPTGGTATNLNSGNVENTNVRRAFNDNSQTYCKYEVSISKSLFEVREDQGGAPPGNRMQPNVPNSSWMSGPDYGTISKYY